MKNNSNTRAGIAFITCLALCAASFAILKQQELRSGFLFLLLPLSVVIPCVFIYPDPVAQLKIFSFELKLRKLEEKESELKELAHRVADLIEAASAGSLVTENFDQTKFAETLRKVREI